MREQIFDIAAGILAGILSGLVILYMLISVRFSTGTPGFVLCLICGFFLPFCLHFRNSSLMSGTMIFVSYLTVVIYALYVGSHSAEEVNQAVFTGSVLKSATFVHLASLAGFIADCFVRKKEHDRISKGH